MYRRAGGGVRAEGVMIGGIGGKESLFPAENDSFAVIRDASATRCYLTRRSVMIID